MEALARQEHGEPVDGEFGRFRDLLEHELASRARHRIRRANLLGLYDWLLADDQGADRRRGSRPSAAWSRRWTRSARRCWRKIRARMTERIDTNRRLWRSRVLRQLTQAWGAGPLAGLLGLWSAGGTLIRSLILLRARTPTQALLAGGLALSQLAGEKWRERQAATAWAAEADLGLTEADLARARTVLRGHLADAEIELPAPPPSAVRPTGDLSGEQLAAVAMQVYQTLEPDVGEVIEHRVARRAGRLVHILFEARLLPPARPTWSSTWAATSSTSTSGREAPLLGLDFFFQAAFWCLALGRARSAACSCTG